MCWSTKDISRTTPLVSNGKVSVIKLVKRNDDGSFFPVYHPEFRYEIGKVAKCDKKCKGRIIKDKSDPEYRIDNGLHSYIKGEVELYSDWLFTELRFLIRTTNSTKEDINMRVLGLFYFNPNLIVMECTIPENMQYYVNRNGEVVSEKLMPIKATMVEEYIQEQNINKQYNVLENTEYRKD